MTNDLLQALTMWVQEADTNRSVHIDLEQPNNKKPLQVFVYDFGHMEGDFITSVEELNNLDLKERKRKRIYKAYIELTEGD